VVRVNDAGIDLAGLVPPPPKPAATDEAGEAESGDAEPGHAGGGHAEADMAAGAVPALDTSSDAPVGGGAGTAD
jgi:hypothetical protein